MSSSSSDDDDDDRSSSEESGEQQVNMDALLEEMGDESDDNDPAAEVFDDDDDQSSATGHEMEEGRKRSLLRSFSCGSIEPEIDCSSSYDDNNQGDEEDADEAASESSSGEVDEDDEDEEFESECEDEEEVVEESEEDEDKEVVEESEEYEEVVEEEDVEEVLEEHQTAAAAQQNEEEEEGSVIDEDNIQDTLERKPKEKKEKIELAKITDTIDEDDPEAVEMKKLLGEWGVDDEKDNAEAESDDDDDDDDSDDEDERIVVLDPNVLDHIVLAAPDLDEAIETFEQMTGSRPVVAGTINGLGIHCARISFNDSSYLEIIAPDSKKVGPIGTLIKTKGVKQLTPFAFAIRTARAEELKREVEEFKYVPDHITMFGGSKDGEPMKWELLFLYGHKLGGMCPFFVDWNNTKHPCAKLPIVGKLKKFTIRAPAKDPVHKLLAHVNAKGLTIEAGKTKFSFQFSSPEGTVKFATSKAIGYKFPGFAEDNGADDNLAAEVDNENEVEFDDFVAPELHEVGDGGIMESEQLEALPPPAY